MSYINKQVYNDADKYPNYIYNMLKNKIWMDGYKLYDNASRRTPIAMEYSRTLTSIYNEVLDAPSNADVRQITNEMISDFDIKNLRLLEQEYIGMFIGK